MDEFDTWLAFRRGETPEPMPVIKCVWCGEKTNGNGYCDEGQLCDKCLHPDDCDCSTCQLPLIEAYGFKAYWTNRVDRTTYELCRLVTTARNMLYAPMTLTERTSLCDNLFAALIKNDRVPVTEADLMYVEACMYLGVEPSNVPAWRRAMELL